MIEKIEMYKVGFGDCFICSDGTGNNKMLVDFGSKQTIPPQIINQINSSLSKTEVNYLMITHFHSDHFSGLRNLNNALKFAEIYLPNFFTKSIIKLEFIALISNPKNYMNHNYNIAFNLLTSISTLARLFRRGSRVLFLNRSYRTKHGAGAILANSLDNLRILWPDMDYVERYAEMTTEIIKERVPGEWEHLLDKYVNQFIEIISRVTDNGVVYFHEGNDENFEYIFKLVEECEHEINLNLPDWLLYRISSFQNKVCLCFDNANEDNDKPVLFLSDIAKTDYEQLTTVNDLADYYSAIKVPHHGTRAYFIGDLPDSESLLIPNDDRRYRWSICIDYFTTYCSRKIYPNFQCCLYKCNKTTRCSGVPNYFCEHLL